MNRNEIKIGRLEIRWKGSGPESARELSASIGEEVLQQIAQQVRVARGRRAIRIAQIDGGTLSLEGDPQTRHSHQVIAGEIAARVGAKVAPVLSGAKR